MLRANTGDRRGSLLCAAAVSCLTVEQLATILAAMRKTVAKQIQHEPAESSGGSSWGASQVRQEDTSWPQQPQQCVTVGASTLCEVGLPLPPLTIRKWAAPSRCLEWPQLVCKQRKFMHGPRHPSAKGVRLSVSSATCWGAGPGWKRRSTLCHQGLLTGRQWNAECQKALKVTVQQGAG